MNSDLQAIYVMWQRQMKRFLRARSRLVANVIQPFFFLAILGFGFAPAKFPGMPSELGYLDFLTPGIITMAVIFSSAFSGVSILWDKQFGFLQEVLVAPVRRLSIVIGRTLGGSTISLIQGFTIMVIASLLGARLDPSGILPAFGFMCLIAFTFVGFGILLASRMEDIHGFQLVMNLVMMPLVIMSSAFFPMTNVPAWLGSAMMLDPLTYGVDGIRGCLLGFSYFPLWLDASVNLGLCALMLALGSYSFSKSEV